MMVDRLHFDAFIMLPPYLKKSRALALFSQKIHFSYIKVRTNEKNILDKRQKMCYNLSVPLWNSLEYTLFKARHRERQSGESVARYDEKRHRPKAENFITKMSKKLGWNRAGT